MIERIKKAIAALFRNYSAAVPSKTNATRRPQNRSADQEALPPFGADALRAHARDLVRNNAYAAGVVDSIVSSVVGTGIKTMSCLETQDGEDVEVFNELRDDVWQRWCKVAELTGQYTWEEIQQIAQREIAEAGEVLIHLVNVPLNFRGIKRPVPFAIELIESDRLAVDRDTFIYSRSDDRRISRGVELDEIGKPVAYWVYPAHPTEYYSFRREPVRIEAENILHLFRRQRIGQNRGVTWLAPVVNWLRDMGVYVDNEMQAGAVSSCLTAFIKTTTPMLGLQPPGAETQSDSEGNQYDYLEPGAIFRLNPEEDVAMVNPLRPNSNAEPWLQLMQRGIAVGTGLSYELVSRDYSQTNYSSSRTSQLQDRRLFRMWQNYLIRHLCSPVWQRFCEAAALTGLPAFPSMDELIRNPDRYAPAEFMPPSWEWVDPQNEQAAATNSINSYQSTYAEELGSLGKNWRHVFYQRAKEESLLNKLGLVSPAAQAAALAEAQMANAQVAAANAQAQEQTEPEQDAETTTSVVESIGNVAATALNGAQVTSLVEVINQVGMGALPKASAVAIIQAAFPSFTTQQVLQIINPIEIGTVAADGQVVAKEETVSGEMANTSTLQFKRNRKAIETILTELAEGTTTEQRARAYLSSIGLKQSTIDLLIEDAMDGSGKIESTEEPE